MHGGADMRNPAGIMTRRRAVLTVLAVAAALALLIALRGLFSACDAGSPEGRERFLARLGWQIDPAGEERQSIRLPETLDGALLEYNRMQRAQGYDLSRHLGERCEIYSYPVTNYPDCSQTVLVTLYVQGRRVIAGDVHSTALDGFMHGIKTK